MSLSDKTIQAIATDTAHRLQPILQSNLQDYVQEAGWPPHLISAVTVDFDGSNLSVKYPDELANEVDDLEYGKPYSVPKPAIRPFIYNSEAYIKDMLAENVIALLLDAEEVI